MKRVLVFLLACLSSTVMFAQTQTLHYVKDWTGCGAMNTKITGVFTINDVEVYNGAGMQEAGGGNLEIGVFDQDGVCRGAQLPLWRAKSNQWVYQLQFRGVEGYSVFHFKVYDHATETELDLIDDFVDEITYQGNYTYQWNGSNSGLTNPYHLNFTYPAQTFTKDIVGVGADNWNDQNGGYYLIASPITEEVMPDNGNGFITTAYDLYYFDQAQELEWINYQNGGGFNLVSGKGYLYASKEDTQLTFTGTPYSGNGEVTLTKTEGAEFEGWNLIGNPFAVAATPNKPYYRLNTNGNAVNATTETTAVGAMEGIFVEATADGETVTFTQSKGNGGKTSQLNINLSEGNRQADNAIVRFDNGSLLEKFSFRQGSSKVYMQREGKDYAIVNADEMGEIPVSFKAEKNGNYSLSFTSQEVGFTYLHLIDNLTGNDVNLLETPSYSFDAQVTDYAQRFRLVFATGSSVDGDSFGFINAGGNFCIYGIEGEATVQVMDVVGHVLSSDTFSGSYERKLDVASGVYMIRLINGNDVKVQKIVVR